MTVSALFAETKTAPANGESVSLGPAKVLEVGPTGVTVTFADHGAVRATIAVAFPYAARAGDDVLVIGKAGRYWVIGVEQSSGPSSLSVNGDLELRATGKLTLAAEEGVAIATPDVEIRTKKLRVFAESVLEHAQSMALRVREVYTLFAGEAHNVVEGTHTTQAKRAKVVTEETVSINGREIHLG